MAKAKENGILNKFDLKRITQKKRKNNFNTAVYEVDKEKKELELKKKLDDIKVESFKTDAETSMIDKKIDNASAKNELNKVDCAVDMNNVISENRKNEIKKTIKDGKKFSFGSLVLGLVSAGTTIVSLILNETNNSKIAVIIVSCLALCFYVNKQINYLPKYIERFAEEGRSGKIKIIEKIFLIAGYTIFSIMTNIGFWKQYFDGIALWTFAIGFDLMSVEMALDSYQNKNLLFNKKTINEINSVFENRKREKSDNVSELKKKVANY